MRLDEFESVFRSALKPRYRFARPDVERVLVLTDLSDQRAPAFDRSVRTLLEPLGAHGSVDWQLLCGDAVSDIDHVVEQVRGADVGLVVTHRHVLSRWRDTPHAIGSALEVLTQLLDVPVLMTPSPDQPGFSARSDRSAQRVLVVADHLAGDQRLIDWGLHITHDDGTIVVAHVEDERVCERYLDAISKIPTLDTDIARRELPAKLLGDANAWIMSVVEQMQEHGVTETLIPVVRLGTPLAVFMDLVAEHTIDLVVARAKENGQHAMEGTAFALATELHETSVLLL